MRSSSARTACRSAIGLRSRRGSVNSLMGSTRTAVGLASSRVWKYLNRPTRSPSETAMIAIKAKANFPMAQTLTSPVSWPGPLPGVSGGRVSGIPVSARCGLFSAMFQSLLQKGFVERHQRALFQLHQEVRQPDSHDAARDRQVQPVQAETLLAESGRDQPVEVHQ